MENKFRPTSLQISGHYPEDEKELFKRLVNLCRNEAAKLGLDYDPEPQSFSGKGKRSMIRISLPGEIYACDARASYKLIDLVSQAVLPSFAPPSIEVSVEID